MKASIELWTGFALFVATSATFMASPNRQVADSRYSLLVSESLLHHGTFALDRYTFPEVDARSPMGWGGNYQLERIGGHLYYMFPPGSSLLSLPYVAAMNALGVSAARADGTYDARGEKLMQASLAPILMAAFSSLVFFTARLILPLGQSLVVALGAALGTQVWSTASRGLWSHTWGVLLLGVVVHLLLARAGGRPGLSPGWLGTLVAWSYLVRPTHSIAVAAVTAHVFCFHRRTFAPYVAAGGLWLTALVAYSWHHFGRAWPGYFAPGRLDFQSFWIALPGHLVSPSRGLFVFVPVALFVIYLLIRYRRDLPHPRLVVLALASIGAHLIVISGFPLWWAGHCFGPRLTTDLVPWFALLGTLALGARRSWGERNQRGARGVGRRAEAAVGVVLLLVSVGIHARGAMSESTARWNLNLHEHPERLWDWKHPQFLAGRSHRRAGSGAFESSRPGARSGSRRGEVLVEPVAHEVRTSVQPHFQSAEDDSLGINARREGDLIIYGYPIAILVADR